MNEDLNKSPYFDDYDPSKKYTQILAVPGRAEQAREFTQTQTILLDFLKRLSGTLFKEGSVVSGMSLTLQNKLLTVSSGRVYLDGIIHEFDEQSLELNLRGLESIGVKLVKSVVTEAQDISLRDPAQGHANYSQPGSHRVKQDVKLVLNDSTVPTIAEFMDGLLQSEIQRPELDVVTNMLAKRTFDQSGNYKVRGYNLFSKPYDKDFIQLVVEAGSAYVQGYEVVKPSPTIVHIPRSKTSRPVTGELKVFRTGTSIYPLNNTDVENVSKIIATVEVTKTITRGGTPGGTDLLPDTPVVSIQTIKQGATIFTPATYQLSADRVDWSPQGTEPAIGSSYTVTYRYNKVLVKGVDFSYTGGSIDVSLGNNVIVDNSNMLIDYSFYLARIDRVYLTVNGKIEIEQGQSDRPEYVVEPLDTGDSRLSLGTLLLGPNTEDAQVFEEVITRASMKDISSMQNRIDNLEYNMAITDLDNEAMVGESPSNLKGIFTDGFLGLTKADIGHDLFSGSIDIFRNELIQSSNIEIYKPSINRNTSANFHNFSDTILTSGFTEEVLISQTSTSGVINVNPFSVFPALSAIKLTPERDSWVNTNEITVNNSNVSTNTVWTWSGASTSTSSSVSRNSVARDAIISYARPIEIVIEAVDFPPNSDNLRGSIDGVSVDLVPTGTTTIGSLPNTIRADSNGRATAKFKIPSGIRTGAREVILTNGIADGSAIFTSTGIDRTVTTTVTTNTIVTRYIQQVNVDPVAQSFELNEDRFITSINLYFATKPSSSTIARVQLRTMSNGIPGVAVLAETILNPSQVNVSANGSVATLVQFQTPAFCEAKTQYCFVVQTDSSEYQLHYATLGKKDLRTNQNIIRQPYNEGVLFMSSNNITWTADQNSDLKFELNGAKFSPTGIIEFNPVSPMDIDAFVLAVEMASPVGANAELEYRTTSTGGWLPVTPFVARNLSSVASELHVRVKLTSDGRVSAVVDLDSLQVVGTKVKPTSTYVSKLINTSQNFTTVKQVIEAHIPSGSSVVPRLSLDDGASWISPTQAGVEPVDSVFTRYTYSYTIPDSGVSKQYRMRIDLNSDNRIAKPRVRKLLNILT